jgi:hypothetical protein
MKDRKRLSKNNENTAAEMALLEYIGTTAYSNVSRST